MTYENLNKFVELLRAIQIKDNNNVNMGVTGRLGCGKSSLTIQIARRYVEKYFGEKNFDVGKYIAYNNKEVIEKIHSLPEFSPLIADEAIRIAWSRDWNKMDNKELAKLSTQIRTKRLLFFMNIPRLAWIDSMFRTGLLDIWIWVHATLSEEGKTSNAIIFEPDENQGESDQWHMNLLRKLSKGKKARISRFTPIERVMKLVKNHPCYMDSFQFPRVPDDIYARYILIRNKKAFEISEQYIDQRDSTKVVLYNIQNKWDELKQAVENGKKDRPTHRVMSEILGYDPTRKRNILSKRTVQAWLAEIYKLLPEDMRYEQQKKNEDKNKPNTTNEHDLGIVKSAMDLPSKPEHGTTDI